MKKKTAARPARPVVDCKVDELHDYPRNAELFADVSAPEQQEFLEDVRNRGIQVPLEVLPDGTVLCGHRRLAAAKQLGLATVPCVVRDDLANASQAELDRHVITDNSQRRQLSPLDVANCLLKLGLIRETEVDYVIPRKDLVAKLAQRCEMTTRNAQRYFHILDAPTEIQQAFRRSELGLADASAIAQLYPETQNEILDRVAAGEKTADVVRDYLSTRRRARKAAKSGDSAASRKTKAKDAAKTAAASLTELADVLAQGVEFSNSSKKRVDAAVSKYANALRARAQTKPARVTKSSPLVPRKGRRKSMAAALQAARELKAQSRAKKR